MLIHWRGNGQIRNTPQSSHIEGAMMRRTILTHQSSTVETQNYRKFQDSHIMDDIIVGSLCKCAIDITERYQSVLCHTCRERHGMTLSNTHIKHSVRQLPHGNVHRTTRRHGWRDANYLFILTGQFK